MEFVFPPMAVPSAQVAGSDARFPVHRIYCVARNYAAHAREMGMNPGREAPFFFTKPVDALVPNGGTVAYPPRTADVHHEIELVVALGRGGHGIRAADALDHVFGYAVGNDLTRRDLQFEARGQGRPWDTAKGFDHSAPMTAIHPVSAIGHVTRGAIWLKVNDVVRQQADVADMIWAVPDVIAELSTLYALLPGDLIFTGTPAGVGPVVPGDRLEGGVDGVDILRTTIT